jgi:S1-C subfamily serine protease
MINFKYLVLALFFGTTSCVTAQPKPTHNKANSKESFVFIRQAAEEIKCTTNAENSQYCQMSQSILWSGSGTIIDISKQGGYILTAAHICLKEARNTNESPATRMLNAMIRRKPYIEILNFAGDSTRAFVIAYSKEIDACILYSHGLTGKASKLAEYLPQYGDEAYTLAAARGTYAPGVVPLFSGTFSGGLQGYYLFAIPIKGGSSGAAVFNKKGEIIGMLITKYNDFDYLGFSPTLQELYRFVASALNLEV